MRYHALWLVLLAGCARAISGAPAGPNALDCAQSRLGSLGYRVVSETRTGGYGSFTAQKSLPPESGYPTSGEIAVSVWRDGRHGEQIRVSASRYEIRGGAFVIPIPTVDPGIQSSGDRNNVTLPRTSRRGRQKLPPGPVAADANLVRQECGLRDTAARSAGAARSDA